MKITVLLLFGLFPAILWAGEADITDVRIEQSATGVYRFDGTGRHADTGWEHYADKWEIVGSDGTVLGTRVLLHPHVGEQPFTRSLPGVKIAPDSDTVTIRAHDSVHGYGGREMSVELPR